MTNKKIAAPNNLLNAIKNLPVVLNEFRHNDATFTHYHPSYAGAAQLIAKGYKPEPLVYRKDVEALIVATHAPNLDNTQLSQPYEGAITLLETIAECGATAFFEDGSETPNRKLCLQFAEELRICGVQSAELTKSDKRDAEIMSLYRQLAHETLRADQGWERYESANRDRHQLRASMMGSIAHCAKYEIASNVDSEAGLRDALESARAAMQKFIDKCESGGAKSKESYAEFKGTLAMIESLGHLSQQPSNNSTQSTLSYKNSKGAYLDKQGWSASHHGNNSTAYAPIYQGNQVIALAVATSEFDDLDEMVAARCATLTSQMTPESKLTIALPDYDKRRIVIASDEVIDGERVLCVAIEEAAESKEVGK